MAASLYLGVIMARNIITKIRKEEAKKNAEWYSLRSLLGYQWALFLMMLGGREAGKSYATTDFFLQTMAKI